MAIYEEYMLAIGVCSPLFLFIVAVTFRLLDNSASIFLSNEIMVDSSYVSQTVIKREIDNTEDKKIKKGLKRALVFRRLHNIFMLLMVVSIPVVIICFFVFYY